MNRPTTTISIDNRKVIESLQGPKKVSSYLEAFPDHIYNVSPDSRLYKFIYSLLGPAGVNFLKINYFYARLVLEAHGLNFDQLDKLYGDPFKFARNFDESYLESWKNVLDSESWNIIKAADESYRKRAIDYFYAARLGCTVEGMRLAARSALGYDTKIIENYQYVFNAHNDQILKYNFVLNSNTNGSYNINEFTIAPDDLQIDLNDEIVDESLHLLESALENIKSEGTIFNVVTGEQNVYEVDVKANLASSEYHEVLRFVTGNTNIPWPKQEDLSGDFKSIYWIESGIEKESLRRSGDFQQHYQSFYPIEIDSVSSDFGQGTISNTSALVKKFPVLKLDSQSTTSAINSNKSKALASYTETVTVTNQNASTNTLIVNNQYSIDYLKLNNVPSIPYDDRRFWMSGHKLASTSNPESGTDYIIIDLKKTVGVNYLIFEVLSAPININIYYSDDIQNTNGTLLSPYQKVSLDPLYPANEVLDYDNDSLNKWSSCPFIFDMVFARYIKIEFVRNENTYLNQVGFLIDDSKNPPEKIPWPIVVKNLRVGRNIV